MNFFGLVSWMHAYLIWCFASHKYRVKFKRKQLTIPSLAFWVVFFSETFHSESNKILTEFHSLYIIPNRYMLFSHVTTAIFYWIHFELSNKWISLCVYISYWILSFDRRENYIHRPITKRNAWVYFIWLLHGSVKSVYVKVNVCRLNGVMWSCKSQQFFLFNFAWF